MLVTKITCSFFDPMIRFKILCEKIARYFQEKQKEGNAKQVFSDFLEDIYAKAEAS